MSNFRCCWLVHSAMLLDHHLHLHIFSHNSSTFSAVLTSVLTVFTAYLSLVNNRFYILLLNKFQGWFINNCIFFNVAYSTKRSQTSSYFLNFGIGFQTFSKTPGIRILHNIHTPTQTRQRHTHAPSNAQTHDHSTYIRQRDHCDGLQNDSNLMAY